MFLEIVRFELWYRFRQPATYIYLGVLAGLGILFMMLTGGAFQGVSAALGSSKVYANSPFTLAQLMMPVSVLAGVLITTAMMGNAVLRDFDYRIHPLFFTTPISKAGYLGGRFTGAILATAFVLLGIPLGLFLGTLMPGIQLDKLGPFSLMGYLQPFITVLVPNLLLTGAIFFTLATLTRNVLATYVGTILFLILYIVSRNLLRDLDNETLANLLDPLGAASRSLTTKYWTTAEKNTRLLPLDANWLMNRALWLGIAGAVLGLCYYRFRFSFAIADASPRVRREAEKPGVLPVAPSLELPVVRQDFSSGQHLRQFGRLVMLEFKGIIKSVYFIAIVVTGLAFLLSSATQIGKLFGTATFPVTPNVVFLFLGSFTLFILAVITFYAGELVWRERDSHINQIYDALPLPNWVPFTSKLGALMLVQVVMLLIVLVAGLITQIIYGYFEFELGVYLKWLFGLKLIDYLLLCVLAMLVQVLVNNKYLGHFVMVLYYVFTLFAGQLGLEHNLFSYGSDPGLQYSAMNGFGHFVVPYLWFKLYWGALAVAFAVVANAFWVRGTETHWPTRVRLAARRLTGPARLSLVAALLLFVATGGFIFYNTNILNRYQTSKAREKEQVQYEKAYKRYGSRPQPRIVAVAVNVDLFPSRQEAQVKGTYWLRNKTARHIDSVQLNLPAEARIRELSVAGAQTVLRDSLAGFYIQRLTKPLAPGDSVQLRFNLAYVAKGFENSTGRINVVYNGTFANSSVLPSIGYSKNSELSDEDARKKNGLPPQPRMASVRDTAAARNNALSTDADWVRYEAVVSTEPDQIALSPGYLQREWVENGRRYFSYKMDAPILNFFSYQSARYAVRKDKWQNVDIAIYYQPGHEYNLDRMVRGVKDALTYYSAAFGPYQHRQVRILEFPGYRSFAQSFPNTIPFSEAIGFIADVDDTDPESVDYPYYVTAHEVAHQWWGHQVVGADVQGSTLLIETLSQYSALMVMKRTYGEAMMKKFLKYETDRYLTGRGTERRKELPLALVENQQYIHYNKGSLVMYTLQDYLGEDKVNSALKAFLAQYKFQQPPYTNSLELVRYLRGAAPDSLQYLVTDMFEKITLYENRTDSASYKKLPNGQYQVNLAINAKKFYADSLGNENEAKMNDWVDVGVLARRKEKGQWRDVYLYRRKQRLHAGLNRIAVTVAEKPEKAGVDPFAQLIDRNPGDNVKTLTGK
ncbi:hypothetical protein LJY25_13895 [Hymenobacter sp. BT175]|uniref:ABC transporter permease/M1 family aminopeptidase n=1 Tax=Hymenobacter translucens TaxID=2886507 RepID=UPI001D0F17B1|nr:M1 family aminopeptidase [Hymenobacter translucens]MCC2547544.1 hypothetical protein [Hymenobacter translucens]